MSKYIIYGVGLFIIAFVIGLLLFLTIDNASHGQAIYGGRFGSFSVTGPASILVNLGIIGIVGSLLVYLAYLFSRNAVLLKSYKFLGAASGLIIFIGWVWGQS